MALKNIAIIGQIPAQVGAAFQGGIIFYDGESVLPISSDPMIHAVPIAKLWGN